jgi:hypothetical protein
VMVLDIKPSMCRSSAFTRRQHDKHILPKGK